MSDDRVLALLRLRRSRWGAPLPPPPGSRVVAYVAIALCLWLTFAVGAFLVIAFVIALAADGTSMLSLGVFTALWIAVTAFGWVVVRRSYLMGARVLPDAVLIIGPFTTRRLPWRDVGGVALKETRVAGVALTMPLIETPSGECTVWDGRLRTFRPEAAGALRDAIASEAARHAA